MKGTTGPHGGATDAANASRARRSVPGALALLALPLLALLTPAAEANSANCSASSGPYPAHEDWALMPSGLDAGDKFRLLFATSEKRRASSVVTDSYNESVRSAAKGGHGKLSDDCAKKFAAIISTEYDSARFNTKTRSTDTGASIWWLTGEKVADDYADFYDGDLGQPRREERVGDEAKLLTGMDRKLVERFYPPPLWLRWKYAFSGDPGRPLHRRSTEHRDARPAAPFIACTASRPSSPW